MDPRLMILRAFTIMMLLGHGMAVLAIGLLGMLTGQLFVAAASFAILWGTIQAYRRIDSR